MSVTVYDYINSFGSTLNKSFSVFKQNQTPPIEILPLVFVIVLTMVIISSIFILTVSVQKQRKRYQERTKLHNVLLEVPNSIYRILVTTAAGIPAFSQSNIIYAHNQEQNVTLSGISVSIDTFLESFQVDFLQQVSGTDTRKIGKSRISIIEQDQVNVLIGATESYRIFVFFKEKPSKFSREAFSKAIIEIQERLPLDDLGIIDDIFLGPEIKKLISRHFPVTLLSKFTVNTTRLNELEESNRFHEFGISKKALNLLKRILVIRSHPELQYKTEDFQLKFYKEDVLGKTDQSRFVFIYPEVLTISKEVLGANVKTIYEAIWKGSHGNIQLLIEKH